MRKHVKKRVAKNAKIPTLVTANTQTTLRLPSKLYNRAKTLVANSDARSVNDFIVRALEVYLKALERKRIDDAFAPMAGDNDYQQEALKLAEQFTVSDLESLLLSEKELVAR